MQLISEATYSSVGAINTIIGRMISILGKRLGGKVYGPRYPFSISAKSRYGGTTKGVYFLIGEGRSFRLNFIKGGGDWVIQNVEFWTKPSFTPDFNYRTDSLSTVEVLDLITAVFGGKTTVEDRTVKKLIKEGFSFSGVREVFMEAKEEEQKGFDRFIKEKGYSKFAGSKGSLAQEWVIWAEKNKINTTVGAGYSLANKAIASGKIELQKATKSNISSSTGAKKQNGAASIIRDQQIPESILKQLEQFKMTPDEKFEKMIVDAKRMMSSATKHGLIVAGSPGVGKSFGLKKWAKTVPGYKEEDHYFRGTATESAFMEQVYFNRNEKLIFFDDCDDVFRTVDPNIWKGLLENERTRKITMAKQLKGSNILKDFISKERGDDGKMRSFISDENAEGDATYKNGKLSFTFKPKVIFITNIDVRNDSKFDSAIFDRVFFTELFLKTDQIAARITKIMKDLGIEQTDGTITSVPEKEKKELLNFIVNDLLKEEFEKAGITEALSIRKYLHALDTWVSDAPKELRKKDIAAMFLKGLG